VDRQIVIAGGSGLIGRALTEAWVGEGRKVVVLTRRCRGDAEGVRQVEWDGRSPGPWWSELEAADVVVNLAGENLAGGRWTAARKSRLVASRVEPTHALVAAIEAAARSPRVYLQSSGVNYYGERGDEAVDESAPAGTGFLAEMAREWEGASQRLEALEIRRILLRNAVVLDRRGGALPRMLLPFRLGVGGRLGDGRQWFPWIHLADEVEAIRFLSGRDSLGGIFNLAAPQSVRNADFTRELGRAVSRPTLLPVPALLLKLLFGEMAEVLLTGQRVVPRRLIEAGFRFRFPELAGALGDLLPRRP